MTAVVSASSKLMGRGNAALGAGLLRKKTLSSRFSEIFLSRSLSIHRNSWDAKRHRWSKLYESSQSLLDLRVYIQNFAHRFNPTSQINNHRLYCRQTDPGYCRVALHFFFGMPCEPAGESDPSPAGRTNPGRANRRYKRRNSVPCNYPPASAVPGKRCTLAF